MTLTSGLFSSGSGEWETPQEFFDRLDAEFHFDLDAAASPENAKCEWFYTKEDNALEQSWYQNVWCNPPYGRIIGEFVRKGYLESRKGSVVVMLIPARTDTRRWHDYVMKAAEIRLVRGRLRFVGGKSCAPFPSAVVVFRNRNRGESPILSAMDANPRRKP